MEIGSWQGQSALFLLVFLEKAKLTCVDTWEGADEHKSGHAANHEILSKVERVFDANLSEFKDRVAKYKGTSYQYFNDCFKIEEFDLIYIDGSHHSDDVLVDAIKSFEMLKVGGLIIFDDYFWKYYSRTIDNPSGAINAFMRLKRNQIKVICFDYQLIIRKTSSSVRWSD
jgi:predicted O-methyltransferase YrrM